MGLFTWNPDEVPEELNIRFAYMKAIEWVSLPLFLGQVIAPLLLLLLIPWWIVALSILFLQWCWILARYRLLGISFEPDPDSVLTTVKAVRSVYGQPMVGGRNLLTLACTVGMVVKLKWPISIASGVFLFIWGENWQAIAAFLWPILTLFLMMFSGGGWIGVVQKRFLLEMGFVPLTGDPSSCLVENFRRV